MGLTEALQQAEVSGPPYLQPPHMHTCTNKLLTFAGIRRWSSQDNFMRCPDHTAPTCANNPDCMTAIWADNSLAFAFHRQWRKVLTCCALFLSSVLGRFYGPPFLSLFVISCYLNCHLLSTWAAFICLGAFRQCWRFLIAARQDGSYLATLLHGVTGNGWSDWVIACHCMSLHVIANCSSNSGPTL